MNSDIFSFWLRNLDTSIALVLDNCRPHTNAPRLKSIKLVYLPPRMTASTPLDYAAFASALNAQYVHADISFINQAFVKDAKQRGLKVNVYTVDQPADIEKLFGWGVDGIFSNYPAEAREVIKSIG